MVYAGHMSCTPTLNYTQQWQIAVMLPSKEIFVRCCERRTCQEFAMCQLKVQQEQGEANMLRKGILLGALKSSSLFG